MEAEAVAVELVGTEYDYTLPIAELRRVGADLRRMVGNDDEDLRTVGSQKNGRARIRMRAMDILPAAIELDRYLRSELKVKGLVRVKYHVWQQG